MKTADETERVRRYWDHYAPKFDRSMDFWEKVLFPGGRQWVCAQASGEALEIAVGTGRNLRHYPEGVRLTGIELSPAMLEIAREHLTASGREANFRLGDAQALDFPDESFDTVVCTLSLCSIPDDRKAVSEMKRVLRSGGRLLLMEHVRSPSFPVRTVQRALNWFSLRFSKDHLLREPLDHLRVEGFEVEEFHRSKWGLVERVRARKPSSER